MVVLKVKINNSKEPNFEIQDNTINGEVFQIDIAELKAGTFHVLRNNQSYTVEVIKADAQFKTITLKVNGNKYELEIRDKFDELLNRLGMNTNTKAVKELKAPMPGMVLDVLIQAGEQVLKDQPLLVLEAMKMENVLKAPADATIKNVIASKGNAVEKNQVLIAFE